MEFFAVHQLGNLERSPEPENVDAVRSHGAGEALYLLFRTASGNYDVLFIVHHRIPLRLLAPYATAARYAELRAACAFVVEPSLPGERSLANAEAKLMSNRLQPLQAQNIRMVSMSEVHLQGAAFLFMP